MIDAPIALYRSPTVGNSALSITGFGRQRIGMRIKDRRLPAHAVVLVEKGRGTLHTERAGTREVVGPALFWLLAGTAHSYGPLQGESWEERWALFTGSFVAEFVRQKLIVEAAPLVPLHNPRDVQHLFGALQSEFAAGDPLNLASSAATLHRIAVETARQAKSPHDKRASTTIERVIEALEQRAFLQIDMNALADEFALSPATLRRHFVATVGMSPKAFQLRLRIDQAKQLLATTTLTIEAISAAVGIDDAFYFSRLFQDRERCSPSEFRRRHRRL
ncbi:AraC family transcriptional regulator [Rhizobium sp. Root1220]|uniref:helix-turn-helix domain-containing protein n=1 Tax=Rhizobium sp. Root1220 TaxID=1736432 RepID=UPI0006F5E822|nr:AraC family transcriptional regulator [Rhizobium sp. Root1220]KQV66265.1 AraC family transcriptional regulator [Rhizobium sp. Root1220]